MLSGLADYRLLQEGYQHGARTFLLKPLNDNDVLQLLTKISGLSVVTEEDGYIIAPSFSLAAEHKTLRFA
jgi:YesN/AraC family two-component response regulator